MGCCFKTRFKYDLRKFYFTNTVVDAWNSLRNWIVIVTFGRLAVIVLLIYCTVLYLDFARWSILDVVDSRNVGEHWSDVF